jgi:integrating conjugative element membrane protein (TIGR03747 family)
MTQNNTATTTRQKKIHKAGVWDWLLGATIGTFFRFIGWSIAAIFIAVLIEWTGMIWFWGPDHSKQILETELDYLIGFNRNMILGIYPSEIAIQFMRMTDSFVSFLHLRELSESLANNITGKASLVAYYGLESLLNTLFIFTVRLSICVSAVTGFALVGLVSFIDGLVERDIRRACGAMESAFVYHRAKRAVVPLIYLSFGGYLTAPISVHPAVVFLPIMALFGLSIFTAAKQFKKFV